MLPDPLFATPRSYVLEARDGSLLSARIATDGQWRFPAGAAVPAKFRRALLVYEDKRFERHPGLDPLAIARAMKLNVSAGRVVSGAKEACRTHRLTHEVLQASEVARRFPAWRLPPEFEAVHQTEAGFLPAERAIVAHVTLARKLGADVRESEAARSWKAVGERVEVETDKGRYEAGSLVLAAGAWTAKLLRQLKPLAVTERQVVGWFKYRKSVV